LLRDRQTLDLPDGTTLEPPPLDIPGRKVVILGDTSDPSAIMPIAMDPSALVHESTNAYIPRRISEKVRGLANSKGTVDSVRKKAIGRGHSTADMAGEFAKNIRARRLYLNHFSTRHVSFFLPSQDVLQGMC
jgi:ribonuclease Z